MKKFLCMLLTMLLFVPAMAEETAIPVQGVVAAPGQLTPEAAIEKALAALPVQPEQYQTRADLVKMSDDGCCWVVTVFDLASLSQAWSMEIDADSGEILASYTAHDGFFLDVYDRWVAQKGAYALWSMEDKALYDALYAMQPMYGLPNPGDMTATQAIERAAAALALAPNFPEGTVSGYQACPGYIRGGEGFNGIWEICMVDNGQVVCQVNLDAVTGEIYYISASDNGNG